MQGFCLERDHNARVKCLCECECVSALVGSWTALAALNEGNPAVCGAAGGVQTWADPKLQRADCERTWALPSLCCDRCNQLQVLLGS